MKPKAGEMAPAFAAQVAGGRYADGEIVSLESLRGSRVVLVFYPKDNTPGCTTQACDLRDRWGDVSARAEIFGASTDGVKSHRSFVDKQQLPYPLLADPEKQIVQAYGVWVEKSLYGKKYMGTERSTFIIGPDGRIEAVLEKVKPKEHLDLLLAALK